MNLSEFSLQVSADCGFGARVGGADRLNTENVTFLRRKASVPLRRALGDATPLAAATADPEAFSLDTEATLGRVKGAASSGLDVRPAGGDAAPSPE